ncbi:MAG: hypothetical protein LBF12_06900 [Christensenellaceae bacterium]|jgi:tetratricopeptide (TPR) repeat protein|nr:hypothetical protein [Christensenellaceae bacterium]
MAIYSLSDNSNDTNFFIMEAQTCLENKNYLGAVRNYKLAIKNEPERKHEFYKQIARIYEDLGCYLESVQIYVELLDDLYCKEYIANIARLLLKMGDTYSAVADFVSNSILRLNQHNWYVSKGTAAPVVPDTEFFEILKNSLPNTATNSNQPNTNSENLSDADSKNKLESFTAENSNPSELSHVYEKMVLSMMESGMISLSKKRTIEAMENLLNAYYTKKYEVVIQIALSLDESSPYLIDVLKVVLFSTIHAGDNEMFKKFGSLAVKHNTESDASFVVRLYKNDYSTFFERLFRKMGSPHDELEYFRIYLNKTINEDTKPNEIWEIPKTLITIKRYDLLTKFLDVLNSIIPDTQLYKITFIIISKILNNHADASKAIKEYREFYFTDYNGKCVEWLINHENKYIYDWLNYFFAGISKTQEFATDFFNNFADKYIDTTIRKNITTEMLLEFRNTFDIVCQYGFASLVERMSSPAFLQKPIIKELIFDFLKLTPYNNFINSYKASFLSAFFDDGIEELSVFTKKCYLRTDIRKPNKTILESSELTVIYKNLLSSLIVHSGIIPDYNAINKILAYINRFPDIFNKFDTCVIAASAHYCILTMLNDVAPLSEICAAHKCGVSLIKKCLQYIKFNPDIVFSLK